MIDERIIERIKEIDKNLFIEVFNDEVLGAGYKIKHKDDRSGLVRDVFFTNSLDIQALYNLRNSVDWEAVEKYKNPQEYMDVMIKNYEHHKRKKDLERQGFIMEWNKDHRSLWADAQELTAKTLTKEEKMKIRYIKEMREKNKKIMVGG